MFKCVRRSDNGRREAERNSLADRLEVEAKALADLKIEKAAAEGERRTVEADPVRWNISPPCSAKLTKWGCGGDSVEPKSSCFDI
jgi:hypothetical protein